MIQSLQADGLSACRCEYSRSILVANITNEQFRSNIPALKLYFGNQKRSGGGTVDTVQVLPGGSAIITFQDHNGKHTDPRIIIICYNFYLLSLMCLLHSHLLSPGEDACKTWS